MTLPRHKKVILASTAVSALLLTAACGSSDDSSDASPSTSASAPATSDSPAADSSSSSSYKAGDYEAEGSYSNPGGESTVKVALTLESDGTISSVKVTPEADNGTSRQYQEKFAGGISGEVVGKSIDSLDVSVVSGSSLTSGGFNQAIDSIKSEAAA